MGEAGQAELAFYRSYSEDTDPIAKDSLADISSMRNATPA